MVSPLLRCYRHHWREAHNHMLSPDARKEHLAIALNIVKGIVNG